MYLLPSFTIMAFFRTMDYCLNDVKEDKKTLDTMGDDKQKTH